MAYSRPPIGIIGDGRLAKHFVRYFSLLGLPYVQWSRQSARETGQTPSLLFQDVERILVLVKDAAIEPVIKAWPELQSKKLIHCSGCIVTPLAYGAHPLMTFGPDLYPLSTYQSVPFVLERGGPPLHELLPELPNPSFEIAPEAKPLYHALCVMGGSFSTLLWQKVFEEFEKLGIPAYATIPYLEQITQNLSRNPKQALTGPMVRKDRETVQKNLAALQGSAGHKIYESFLEVFAPDMKDPRA